MVDDLVVAADWHPVARVDAVTKDSPVAARLLSEDIVLWRSENRVSAWRDLCIHRGTRLSLGTSRNCRLICPYHGWQFDESGQCVLVPAQPQIKPSNRLRATVYHAVEKYGLVWVALKEPGHDVPSIPEEHDPKYRKILSGPFGPIHASAPRIIENFLDVAHFPFVHAGTLGDSDHPSIPDYSVEIQSDGVVAENIQVYQPDPYGTGESAIVSYTYRVLRPFTAHLSKETPDGERLTITLFVTPIEERKSMAWFYMATPDKADLDVAAIDAFHSSILKQDVPIVESQRPELLPLDIQTEMHARSDRTGVSYRRWLKELGLSFGTQ